jgi:hypothetical protein
MGLSSKDIVLAADGKFHFIPSGSTTLGLSQSFNSVAQQYVVTMSGASMTQSVIAPHDGTGSYWYFRQPQGYVFTVYYSCGSGSTAIGGINTTEPPTGSTFTHVSASEITGSTISGTPSSSVVRVDLQVGTSGSIIYKKTVQALANHSRRAGRYTISSSDDKYIYITNKVGGLPTADDLNVSFMSGSSITYSVRTSGSGALGGRISEGMPTTGSATATWGFADADKNTFDLALQNSHSSMTVKEGMYSIVVANAATGSPVSLHGGSPIDYGDTLPNNPHIKTNAGFDFLLDNANAHHDHKFRIWTGTGIATVSPGEKLLEVDNSGSLSVTGSISASGDTHEFGGNVYLDTGGELVTKGTTNTRIQMNTGQVLLYADSSNYENIRLGNGASTGGVVINEYGRDFDFRIESDDDTHIFFVDAGNDKVAIGTDTVSNSLLTIDGDVTLTNITASGNISASGRVQGNQIYMSNHVAVMESGDSIAFGFENLTPIIIGKSGNPTKILGHVTASVISASEHIQTQTLIGSGTTTGLDVSGYVSGSEVIGVTGSFDNMTKSTQMFPWYYYNSTSHTSKKYIPYNTSIDTTVSQPNNMILAPYDGQVRRVTVNVMAQDPGSLTCSVHIEGQPKHNTTPTLVESQAQAGTLDDTAYHFDFSSSFTASSGIYIGVEYDGGTANTYVHGTTVIDFNTSKG